MPYLTVKLPVHCEMLCMLVLWIPAICAFSLWEQRPFPVSVCRVRTAWASALGISFIRPAWDPSPALRKDEHFNAYSTAYSACSLIPRMTDRQSVAVPLLSEPQLLK